MAKRPADSTTPRAPRCSKEQEIVAYIHCPRCQDEMPPGQSPRTWARTSVGWTKYGLQLWCDRHEINICNIDFHDQTLTALSGP